jgi:hypothetical protein
MIQMIDAEEGQSKNKIVIIPFAEKNQIPIVFHD